MRPSERGITLRESLLAAAILVALAIVSTAILSKQRKDALRIGGIRNLQQWGIALNLHLIENESQLPQVGTEPVTAEQKSAWFNALPPYISQTPLADLPSGRRPRPGVPSIWIDPASKPVKVWDPDVFYFNYGMNAALQPQAGTRSFRIYEIDHPSNVVFMARASGYSPGIRPADVIFGIDGRGADPAAEAPVLFCDGHVEPVSRRALTDPKALNATAASDGVSWFAN